MVPIRMATEPHQAAGGVPTRIFQAVQEGRKPSGLLPLKLRSRKGRALRPSMGGNSSMAGLCSSGWPCPHGIDG
jgi:hypothetical protein